ncbi:hypothetical protein Tco_1010902 [Tanacetum coccineum]
MLPDDEPLPNNLGGVYCRNLGVEGSSACIFGIDLVAGQRVSALLVVVGQDNLRSGSASGLVGNFCDNLGVAGERVSAPMAVVGQDNLRRGSGSASGLVGNSGEAGVVGGAAPRSGGPTGRSGKHLVVVGVVDSRSVGPARRSGECLVVAGVAAPRSGGPTGRSSEHLVVASVVDLINVGPTGSVGSRANAIVRSSVSTDMVGIFVDGHMGVRG